jgi:hypothetical protein
MSKVTQFCVGLPDQPGVLADLCGALRTADVNINALFVSDDPDCCWVNMIVQPVDAARRVLQEGRYNFFTEQVLAMKLANHPGELERVAKKLAAAHVNINYVYGSCADSGGFTLVINVSDPSGAAQALRA